MKVTNSWVGYYAYNRLDQNVIVGAHRALGNFMFVNGFSGHGLQQAPAIGHGIGELIINGAYQTLDLSPLGMERMLQGMPLQETAII